MANLDVNVDRSAAPEFDHSQVLELLSLYTTLAALGRDPQAVYPAVAAHLQDCPICRSELTELQELVVVTYADQVEPALAYPRVDLAFLSPSAPAPKARGQPWRINKLGHLLVEFSTELIEQLRPHALAGAARGQLLYSYTQDQGSIQDLDARIEVFAMHGAPGQVLVRVTIDVPSRGAFDQSGSMVVLRAENQEWRGETDEAGQVDFTSVPLVAVPMLRIEIMPLREG